MRLTDGKNCAFQTQLFQNTVGTIYPHTRAKVVDLETREVAERGERGELLVSGYSVQKGYWSDPVETAKAMIADQEGRVWMQTGDIACIDNEGLSIPLSQSSLPGLPTTQVES
jgi:long-subunit acyl-CoA synthetase (AMP-forming)